MKQKNYLILFFAICLILLIGNSIKIYIDKNQTTFYRTEEVALADDYEVSVDEEGRIFVENPFKVIGKPEAEKIRKEQEENPEIKVDETVVKDSTVSLIIENEKIKLTEEKKLQEMLSSGKTEMENIVGSKLEEKREAARKEEEKQKALKEAERKRFIDTHLTGVDDLRTPSNLTPEQLEKGLKSGLSGLGKYFIEAEKTYGVNAVFLASVAALESAWGTSNYAVKRNNLFGYGAYTSNPDHAYYFKTKRVAILYVAQKLRTNYLTPGGSFFNGYTLEDVNKKYCTNPQWANLVGNIMKEITKKIKN